MVSSEGNISYKVSGGWARAGPVWSSSLEAWEGELGPPESDPQVTHHLKVGLFSVPSHSSAPSPLYVVLTPAERPSLCLSVYVGSC